MQTKHNALNFSKFFRKVALTEKWKFAEFSVVFAFTNSFLLRSEVEKDERLTFLSCYKTGLEELLWSF